ncbi:uncharacterized protein [Coffea arabica]|uniref:Reverse transcriptase domain-containing protein n=1 Tax=Coffea arabica TaxID=13443 RepID=A0ABM4X6Y3_COFAR
MEGPPWPPPVTGGVPGGAASSKSFADVLSGSGRVEVSPVPDLGCWSTHRGEPALRLSQKELQLLSTPFKNALVGRFPFRRPPMEVIRGFFVSLGLKGDCDVGLLDMNHVLIRPSTEEDFTRLFVRRSWFVKGAQMLLAKWTLDFKAHQDSTYAPVWVSLPTLPLPLFNAVYIVKLAGLLGRCLKIDSATLALRRSSVARVLVEMDVSKQPPNRIWIGEDQEGFWQDVEYESWPKFCGFCTRFGHADGDCYRKNPDLKPSKKLVMKAAKSMEVYRPKGLCGPDSDPPQRDCSIIQLESHQLPVGALVPGQAREGQIDVTIAPEVIARSDMGEVKATIQADTVTTSVADVAFGGVATAGILVAADAFADESERDPHGVEQGSARSLAKQSGGWEGMECGQSVEVVAVSSNSFAVLHSLSDMEVQDFERDPSRSASHARTPSQRHRRQCSDGDKPGEVVSRDQLKQFHRLLLQRRSVEPGEGLLCDLDGSDKAKQQEVAANGQPAARHKGGRPAKAILNQSVVWNIRGASRKDSLRYLHKICKTNKIRLLVLLEPLSDTPQLEVVRRLLGFDSALGALNNKVWVFWYNDMSLSFKELAEQLLHMHITFSSGCSIQFSAVYARCTRVGRRDLWSTMDALAGEIVGPWLLAGDFNVISSMEERVGGSPANERNMEEFNDSIGNCGLTEVPFDGALFTWTNGRVWQRLDRALMNRDWAVGYEFSHVSHLCRGRSDHAPLLISCQNGSPTKHSFKFLNVWRWHSGFMEVVQQGWAMPVGGDGMTKFNQKLRAVKGCLRGWNVQVFGNIFNRVREAEVVLKQREEQYDIGRDSGSRAALEEAKAVYARSLAWECEYWRQKAGIRWLQVGDANSAFFHSRCRQRRNFNFVARIKDQSGTWLENIQDIRRSAVDFFASLFASEQHGWQAPGLPFTLPHLSAADNAMLSVPPDMDELKGVIFALQPDSAPGPDGFGAGFYQACWDIIKSDLLEAVQAFFQGMRLPRSFTSTSILLLPKVAGATQWKDFRPISLCNVCSKIISKIVSDRLGRVLPALVAPWQTGFVPGRGITDNILLTQELVADFDRRLRHPNLMLKLDMEKAYDRVEWPFLLFMLRNFGFEEQVVDIIFRLVSNNWFSVLVNGEAAGFFKSSRGLRQGDPVSPALFVLIADFLGRGLHHLLVSQPGRCFVSSGTPVPYLAFADDMLIFTRCSEECLTAIKGFLTEYQEASGQRVNSIKSSFFLPSGATSRQEELVHRILGFHRQSFPFTYLGAPIYKGRQRGVLFDDIVSKMRARLGHWSTKLLSFGGKLVLARHVLASLPMYLLQVLDPPKAVLTRLGRICNSFLWDHQGERRIHWSSWDKLCFPFDEGGLGFRSFKDMARAFAAKLWWRFRLGDSIWAAFMQAKYIKGIHPLEVSAMRATATWRRLEVIGPVVEPNIRWSLGEGLVDFWKDRWVFHEPLQHVVVSSERPHFLVSEFITLERWDERRLARWVPEFVVRAIIDIPFDLSQKDRMVWLPSPSGCFSVKSAWEVLRQRRHHSLVDSLLWPSVLPAKMSFLAWRLVRNVLPLDVALRSRGLALPSRCGCCYLEEEALLYVFLTGPVASEVWRRVSARFGFQLQNCLSMASVFVAWYFTSPSSSKNHIRAFMPVVVCWFLWLARNQERYHGVRWGSDRIIHEVDDFLEQLGRANRLHRSHFTGDADCELLRLIKSPPRRRTPRAIAWVKPPLGVLKFNSDASVNQGRASGGGLLRDYQGKVIFAFYKEFGEQDVLSAESLALLFGLQLCLQRGLRPSLVEVDFKALVQLVVSGAIAKWPLCNILRKIRCLLEGFSASVSHIFREANSSADRLAAVGAGGVCIYDHVHQVSAIVRASIVLDSCGVPCVRWFDEEG